MKLTSVYISVGNGVVIENGTDIAEAIVDGVVQ